MFLGPENTLSSRPEVPGAHAWTFDLEAGTDTFFGRLVPSGASMGYRLDTFTPDNMVSYRTEPFIESKVITGPGIAELWVKSPVDDVTVQVTLTEVRPDGYETLIQSGWLRLGHRASEADSLLRVQRSFSAEAFREMPIDQWERLRSHCLVLTRASRLAQYGDRCAGKGLWNLGVRSAQCECTLHSDRLRSNVSSILSLGTLPGIGFPKPIHMSFSPW